jgi:hypothetical protein
MIMKILNNNTYESFNLISSTRIYKNNSSKEKNNIIVNPSKEDDYYNCLKIFAENLVLINKLLPFSNPLLIFNFPYS